MPIDAQAKRATISPEELAAIGGPKMVYIREMDADEIATLEGLPEEARADATLKLYAVHTIDGTRVAIVDNRDAAFAAARQNEMDPVSVH